MTGAADLVASAFGPGTTLYGALGAKKNTHGFSLKRAYRKSALRCFHPDRIHSRDSKDDDSTKTAEERIRRATLKFQAVSAAYEVLMDPKRRSVYDATGVASDDDHDNDDSGSGSFSPNRRNGARSNGDDDHDDDDDDADDDDDSGSASFPSAPRNGARSSDRGDVNQQRWEEFFPSIFHEIVMGLTARHGIAGEYRGSDAEARDVLKYWATCRGDVEKMVLCIVHAESGDGGRWMRDIVDPAIRRGEVVDYDDENVSGAKRKSGGGKKNDDSALVDSDSDDDSIPLGRPKQKRTKKRKKLRKMGSRPKAEEPRNKKPRSKRASRGAFSDTDDEKDDEHVVATSSDQASMSKRDKMEYRVAKIRKKHAQRDLEGVEIVRSKHWSGSGLW